jgi:ABC-type nitrate/sulfonate/bicarbonate transport system ATPase subunit
MFWCNRLKDISSAGVPSRLELHIRHKSYRRASGGLLHVLDEITFTVADGEVVALVGPSGCGKTTLLRIIVGLDQAFEGIVTLPALGRLGMVFQEPRLLPWRTVEQNVRLVAPQASEDALTTLFLTLGLAEHRHHYPGELSLGLARRVALARAFVIQPDLLVLDEPFVSLDAALAERLRAGLIELVSRRPTMTLLVTHSIDEAIGLADRVILLSPSPARVIAQIPVDHPRTTLSPAELAAARDKLKSITVQE